MRPNNRTKILDAAVRIAERDGVGKLTLEATAEEAGLTRGGMMYHFRDRDALSLAVQEHVAAGWEAKLVAAAGKSADEATAAERVAAYISVATTSSTHAEVELVHAAGHEPVLREPLDRVRRRWSPSPDEAAADPESMRHFIACLAADGLWSYDSPGSRSLPSGLRATLAKRIIELAQLDGERA
ncbi:TetR/AcrR family transcriptional regulator [Streptosporangium roseum]|uniref:TetR/AcrR family transcriptional regulator n=1 Tax=Streptosporangium roseum TaxID=2001 RepID=UPI003325C1C0